MRGYPLRVTVHSGQLIRAGLAHHWWVASEETPLTAAAVLRRDPTLAPVFTAHETLAQAAKIASDSVLALRRDHPDEGEAALIARVCSAALGYSAVAGALCGSSMYLAMFPAMGGVYCRQILMILQIACISGRDPCNSARLADVLVARGNAHDVGHAREIISAAGRLPVRTRPNLPLLRRLEVLVTAGANSIGTQVKQMSLWRKLRVVLMLIGLLFPIVSIPLWAYQYRRSTADMAVRAVAIFTTADPPVQDVPVDAVSLPLAIGRTRIFLWSFGVLTVLGLIGFTIYTARTTSRFQHGGILWLIANVLVGGYILWRLRRYR